MILAIKLGHGGKHGAGISIDRPRRELFPVEKDLKPQVLLSLRFDDWRWFCRRGGPGLFSRGLCVGRRRLGLRLRWRRRGDCLQFVESRNFENLAHPDDVLFKTVEGLELLHCHAELFSDQDKGVTFLHFILRGTLGGRRRSCPLERGFLSRQGSCPKPVLRPGVQAQAPPGSGRPQSFSSEGTIRHFQWIACSRPGSTRGAAAGAGVAGLIWPCNGNARMPVTTTNATSRRRPQRRRETWEARTFITGSISARNLPPFPMMVHRIVYSNHIIRIFNLRRPRTIGQHGRHQVDRNLRVY